MLLLCVYSKIRAELTTDNWIPKAGTPAALYDREQFEADKQAWYQARGCDEHGIPTTSTLRDLELDFLIPTLEQRVAMQ